MLRQVYTYVQKRFKVLLPGANHKIVGYNASTVKIHNATSSLVRFENKTKNSGANHTPSEFTTPALYLIG
jgi:hypothetical protein